MNRRRFLSANPPRAGESPTPHSGRPSVRATPAQPLPYAGGLTPYVPSSEQAWHVRQAQHLLRRAGYAVCMEQVSQLLDSTPQEAVARLVDTAATAPFPPRPTWYDDPTPSVRRDRDTLVDIGQQSIHEALEMRAPGTALRERLTLLLGNILAARRHTVPHNSAIVIRYAERLRMHALGNYRQLVTEIGRDDVRMLTFLDGQSNAVGAPNENYARELLELFTMGPVGPDGASNYTETDIQELARALTGWSYRIDKDAIETFFVPDRHDREAKTIFGRRGAWTYEDALRILFEERSDAIAHFVSRRLYQEFVYDVPNEQVVSELAAVLLAHDFEIAPAVRRLLQSSHFFNEQAFGVKIRSPFDLFVGFLGSRMSRARLPSRTQRLFTNIEVLHPIFNPPDVSGWPGFTTWVDTSTHVLRLATLDLLSSWNAQDYRLLGLSMPDPSDPVALTRDLAGLFVAVPLDPATLAEATEVLLGGTQAYMWDMDLEESALHIRELVRYFTTLPAINLH
ncbi:MAG: DUF1800 family protein [Bacteroidota bacterium]